MAQPPAPAPAPGAFNSAANMQKLLSDPTQLAGLNDRLRTIETMLRKDMERAAELDKAGRTAESAELKKEIRLRAEKL